MCLSRLGRVGLKCDSHIPGQQLLDLANGMFSDLGQHGAKVELRIQAVELGRSCRPSDYAEAEHTVLP